MGRILLCSVGGRIGRTNFGAHRNSETRLGEGMLKKNSAENGKIGDVVSG